MKQLKLKLAVVSALGLVSAQAMATGFVSLPAAGFSVSGGTSAYTLCNTSGNFGTGSATKPTTGSNNTCAVFPATEVSAPVTGFTLVTSASRSVVMNNTYTGSTNKTVGTLTEYVWRNSAQTQCVYGAKVVNNNTDYNTLATGNQYFEVNDIARGGFSGLDISAGYSTIPTISEPVFRIGRTFTAVQYRSNSASYVAQPLTSPGSTASINGINTSATGNPTAAEQSATLNDNWVDFTTDVNFLDDDGSTSAASGMTYVQAPCSSAAPTTAANAIRLRQTFQELSGDGATPNNFIEVSVTGFVPPGATITPAPSNPF